jgi:hypothetical protein
MLAYDLVTKTAIWTRWAARIEHRVRKAQSKKNHTDADCKNFCRRQIAEIAMAN